MKRATIVGATGFGGLGLIEILLRHPEFEIKQLIARGAAGESVSDIFPHLRGWCDMRISPPEETDYNADIVFFSTPDRTGMVTAGEFIKRGVPVIDFSGDFRFCNVADYARYAKNKGMDETHLAVELLANAVYGLPEKNRAQIAQAKLVGNPGCFATAMILGLLPAAEAGLIDGGTIICDGKTGVSGAGIRSGDANLYPQRHENMNTYREGRHQHIVEVENIINLCTDTDISLLFVPQIVPVSRGILMTMYADTVKGVTTEDVQKIYKDRYADEPFVMVTDTSPATAHVLASNRCEVRSLVDERTGKLFITSAIDNLMKGQAGNAVQNANIMLGLNETAGLAGPGIYP